VSEQCLHHAPCPVAIVHTDRPEHTDRPTDRDRIVVGVDGSDDGRRALDWALDEARARRCAVEVVHAWRPPLLAGYPLDPLATGTEEFEDAARTVMGRALEDVDVTGLVGPVEPTLRIARPASALLEAAEHADLVVVGSRGVGGFRGLLVGSVSLQVARHSPCPVVVVRADQRSG
jgi:nucleotide-binding universal stress UspA family protein